ncbi:MAG: hypothetical protein JW795_11540 [Chitinivibrionales bacterium]|nr:hypothetical protein [Chitinivibrionales bacterium]
MLQIKFRIIIDDNLSPDFNMAADLFLMQRCSLLSGDDEVTLRVYSWQPATISLGYMQSPQQVLNGAKLAETGFAWIRRPTGGRAVFHCNDITYSIVVPQGLEAMMGATIAQTYQVISTCLIASFEHLGIKCTTHDSAYDTQSARKEVKMPCFLAPNRNEIMADGKKLVGSAQKRSQNAVLQHGSIPLGRDYQTIVHYLNLETEERVRQEQQLEQKTTFIHNFLPACSFETAAQALVHGFQTTLTKAPWIVRPWSNAEVKEIVTLSHSEEFRKTFMQ